MRVVGDGQTVVKELTTSVVVVTVSLDQARAAATRPKAARKDLSIILMNDCTCG